MQVALDNNIGHVTGISVNVSDAETIIQGFNILQDQLHAILSDTLYYHRLIDDKMTIARSIM